MDPIFLHFWHSNNRLGWGLPLKNKTKKRTPSAIEVASSHGNKPLKCLHASLTVYHTCPSYPIGPAVWSTVSTAVFLLKLSQETQIILGGPGWLIQAQYCPKMICVPLFTTPVLVNPYHDQSHKEGRENGYFHKFLGVTLQSLKVLLCWIDLDPSDHPKQHDSPHPHTHSHSNTNRYLITSVHNCFVCQWDSLWPDESLWRPPKTHNDFLGSGGSH